MVSSGAGELSILGEALRERFRAVTSREAVDSLMEEFVADVAARRYEAKGWPQSAYGVSKAGVNGYVRVRAAELASRKIRLNAVCPGWVRTDMGGEGAPRTIEQGTASILADVIVKGTGTGGFYRDGEPIPW